MAFAPTLEIWIDRELVDDASPPREEQLTTREEQ
jgi:hypothetical protein